jgi:hypothetical protein
MYHEHERRDVNIRGLALFAFSLAVLLAGSLVLMAWLLDIFDVTPEGHGARGAPLAASPPRPPGPQLQTSPSRDMQEMLRAENTHLQSYAWVDRAGGMARIPLDRAMALVVQQGLPSWPEVPAAHTDARDPAQKERQ